METQPLMRFKSHIAGKNADVTLYRDRIEWTRPPPVVLALILALFTAGISLIWVRPWGSSHEVMPIRSVSSVTMKTGAMFSVTSVIATGNTIDFRAVNATAAGFRTALLDLIGGSTQ
jgi:hypothetical protein